MIAKFPDIVKAGLLWSIRSDLNVGKYSLHRVSN